MLNDQIARDIALTRQRFGPQPEELLRAFVDLGLDDCEIGRYHAIPSAAVCMLRRHYRIATTNIEACKADQLNGEMDSDVFLARILHMKGDNSSLPHPSSDGKRDTVKSGLRQFALSMRTKLFDG